MSIPFADSLENPTAFQTGTFIDRLSGIGGIPKGYITELWGRSGVGKSTLALQMVAELQKQGYSCAWADAEFSFTPLYASSMGVDSSKLGLLREPFAENILDTIENEITSPDGKKKGRWDVIFLDSVGGLLSRSEAEKRSGEIVIAAQGKLIAPWVRKVVPKLVMNGVSIVIINHAKQDLMSGSWQPSAGEKLVYHKGFSIYLKYSGESIKVGTDKVGEYINAEVKKNKFASTKRMSVNSHFIFGKGFDFLLDLIKEATDKEIITKKGNTLYFGDIKLGVGNHKARKMIEEDPVLAEKIKAALQ